MIMNSVLLSRHIRVKGDCLNKLINIHCKIINYMCHGIDPSHKDREYVDLASQLLIYCFIKKKCFLSQYNTVKSDSLFLRCNLRSRQKSICP